MWKENSTDTLDHQKYERVGPEQIMKNITGGKKTTKLKVS